MALTKFLIIRQIGFRFGAFNRVYITLVFSKQRITHMHTILRRPTVLGKFTRGSRSRWLLTYVQHRSYGKRHKIYSAPEAVGLIRNNDTISVSGA